MSTSGVGASGAPLLPLRPAGQADLGGAVVRPIAPVHGTGDPLLPDLSRAGVDLPGLLDRGADALVVREQPGSVALAELLERARGALVRGAPMEVLAALDAGWDGAARTESGWYFRASALTLLGLPGEAERVLQQAASVRDRSPALVFLLSVIRSAAGHAAGARAALSEVLAQRPGVPLLRAWDAVLSARGGDAAGAQALLAELEGGGHNDPVIAWARQAILRASANEQRAVRVTGPAASSAPSTPAAQPTPSPAADTVTAASPPPRLDPVDAALRGLGARLGATSRDALEADVRRLMQSLSAMGALQEPGRSGRSHAVRAVLASLHQLLGRPESELRDPKAHASGSVRMGLPIGGALDAFPDAEGSWRLTPVGGRSLAPDAPTTTADAPTLRFAVLDALRAGRLADAERLIEQARGREGDHVVHVLQRLLDGAAATVRAPSEPAGPDSVPVASLLPVRDDLLLAPLRLGLILLQELSPRHQARGVRVAALTDESGRPVGAATPAASRAALAGESARTTRRIRRTAGLGVLALAAIALATGNGSVAMLLVGGAVWLLLR